MVTILLESFHKLRYMITLKFQFLPSGKLYAKKVRGQSEATMVISKQKL